MKEILIICGFIMLVFSYQSFAQWNGHKKDSDSNNQNNQDWSKE